MILSKVKTTNIKIKIPQNFLYFLGKNCFSNFSVDQIISIRPFQKDFTDFLNFDQQLLLNLV